MFKISAAEMIELVQAEIVAAEVAAREAFYADDEIWSHEFEDANGISQY